MRVQRDEEVYAAARRNPLQLTHPPWHIRPRRQVSHSDYLAEFPAELLFLCVGEEFSPVARMFLSSVFAIVSREPIPRKTAPVTETEEPLRSQESPANNEEGDQGSVNNNPDGSESDERRADGGNHLSQDAEKPGRGGTSTGEYGDDDEEGEVGQVMGGAGDHDNDLALKEQGHDQAGVTSESALSGGGIDDDGEEAQEGDDSEDEDFADYDDVIRNHRWRSRLSSPAVPHRSAPAAALNPARSCREGTSGGGWKGAGSTTTITPAARPSTGDRVAGGGGAAAWKGTSLGGLQSCREGTGGSAWKGVATPKLGGAGGTAGKDKKKVRPKDDGELVLFLALFSNYQ